MSPAGRASQAGRTGTCSSVSQRAAAAAGQQQSSSRAAVIRVFVSRARFPPVACDFFLPFVASVARESGKEEEFDPTSEQSDLKMISTGRVLLLCSYASYTGWLGALRS